MNSRSTTPGGTAGTNWDLLAVSGALVIAATSDTPIVIDVLSLTAGNVAGVLAGLAPGRTYVWELATAGGGITGFAVEKFVLNTGAFAATNSSIGGTFALQLGSGGGGVGTSLDLVYVSASAIPEPGATAALVGAALLGVAALRRRRRERGPS